MRDSQSLRFLFLSPGYHPDIQGGAWRMAQELAERLAGHGHEVHVVTNHPGGDLDREETRRNVKIHRVVARSPFSWWPAHAARNREAAEFCRSLILPAHRRFLVGTHHAYFEPAVRSLGQPWISIFEGPWAEEYRWSVARRGRGLISLFHALAMRSMVKQERRLLSGAKRLVVLSRYFEEGVRRWHPVQLPPITRLHGAVDLERFRPSIERTEERRSNGLKADDRLLLAVRRLDPRMGLPVLLKAFARCAARNPRLHLWIAGGGPMADELLKEAEGMGLGTRFKLLGRVEEGPLPGLYSIADLVVMPSIDLEGFGLATIEAMACGTPVIGSSSGANPEVLEPLNSRLLFQAGSVDSLAERITDWLVNPDRYPSRIECREFVAGRYGWEKWTEVWEQWGREAGGG